MKAFAAADGDAVFVAGGQSLVPALALRLQGPALLVDIGRLKELEGLSLEQGFLRIGAATRHCEILTSDLVRTHAPLLAEAAPHVAHPAIRNRGTFGGSLALADPAAEFPAMVLALDALIEIASPEGVRRVAAENFFIDLYETALQPGEVIVAVHIPVSSGDTRAVFDELARRRGDYAIVGAGVNARFDGSTVEHMRIAFLAVGSTPIRARSAEQALLGRSIDADTICKAQDALESDLDPADDDQIPASMRRHLARVLLGRLLDRLEAIG
ncbi:carbon-monoxide dehydrogenase medium subunit [Mycoplana sp. BE70]|nr:carbon-monoxide dehydrogenase medium subunit [Mycoplana sp. BE70]